MNSTKAFQVESLSFAYPRGKTLIKNFDLQISVGKITALLGANGCGKSTLFQLLCRLHKPETGRILLNGRDASKISRRDFAKQVAIVHQYNTAPPDITVQKLVGFGRTPYQNRLCSMMESDTDAVNQALEITNTIQHANTPLSKLSGGERQRVWLAMAIAQSTDILLLDEITTYLDIYYQYELLRLLRRLNEEKGLTIFMILHDINHALEFCDHTVVMKDGTVLDSGNTYDVITSQLLRKAFAIDSKIITLDKKPHCIYCETERLLYHEKRNAE